MKASYLAWVFTDQIADRFSVFDLPSFEERAWLRCYVFRHLSELALLWLAWLR